MIVPYTELPEDAGDWPRTLLDVTVADLDEAVFPCLVDSGSLNTLLPRWIAEAAALDLAPAEARTLQVAGSVTEAALLPVSLSAAGHTWEAPVAFCDPWPYVWGLLGQLSFFRYFTVTFRATDFEFEVVPTTG
ncbi:MAG TPA: aspartyl protease family protein [Acidimicrobiales bacterium]|nr:aspartyl protease family protein [Acidimicrobiales bacterium]